jgi:hypothetical protein
VTWAEFMAKLLQLPRIILSPWRDLGNITKKLAVVCAAFAMSALGSNAFAGTAVGTTCTALAAANLPVGGGSVVNVTVAIGDTLSWNGPGTVINTLAGTDTGTALEGSRTFTAPGVNVVNITLNSSDLSCVLASSSTLSPSNTGGNSQTGATNTGVGDNNDDRLGEGGGNTVTRNRIFMSTANYGGTGLAQADWNAWILAEGRTYSGGLSGGSFDVVAGVDKLIGANALIGVLVAYGRISLNEGTSSAQANSPAIGMYYGLRMAANTSIDAFAMVAQPRNTVDGGTFTSSRVGYGLTFTAKTNWLGQDVSPFLKAKGFNESQLSYVNGAAATVAANTVTSYSLTAGAKVRFQAVSGGMTPYVSVAADYRNTTSTANGTDTYFYPRIGLGISGAMAKGHLNIDLDFGKTRSDTFDRGIKASWEFKF